MHNFGYYIKYFPIIFWTNESTFDQVEEDVDAVYAESGSNDELLFAIIVYNYFDSRQQS